MTISPLILLLMAYILWLIIILRNKKDEQIGQNKKNPLGKPLIYTFLAFSSIALSFLLYVSLFARPYIVLAGAGEDTFVDEYTDIGFRLTVPVLKDSLQLTITPEQKVEIEYDYIGISEEWIDGFKIHPTENYPAEARLVVYVVGLTDVFPGGKTHEQSLEFFTSTLPSVVSTNLEDSEGEISIDTVLEFQLDKRSQKSTKWSVEIAPPVEFELLENEEQKILVSFPELAQGTEYSLKLIKGNRIYNTATGEELRVEGEQVEKEITFKTVSPPGITKFNWDGVSLPNSEPLTVEFSEKINVDIFKDMYRIEPNIAHSLNLGNDGKTLVIKPNIPFAKDTTYKITFLAGLTTLNGGFLEADSTITFKTAGAVRVIYFSPRNGGTGVSINQKSVSVTFDQKVDHESAQASFSISPNIPGNFSWSGNTMVYTFAQGLPYYTRYNINIAGGVKSVYGVDSKQAFSSTFLTEEQTLILKVPQFYQPKGFDCNLYAAKMALAYRGIGMDVGAAKASIGIGENPNVNWVEGYGVHAGPLSRYIGGFRNVAVKNGFSVQALASEIVAGNPVIVYVYNSSSQPPGPFELEVGGHTGYMGMHSEVVVGFTGSVENPTSIITNDPWKGRRKHPVGSFNGLWNYMGRTAVVVY